MDGPWTYREFKSPFDIHTIDDVRILLEALQCGRCCWVRMTKNDISRHREEVNKRIAAGETVGKPRQPRSDKGIKRPRKSAPGAGEGSGDNEEAPQPRSRGRERACLSLTLRRQRKVPRNPRKNSYHLLVPPATSLWTVTSD